MTLATALTGRTVIHGLSACMLTGWRLPSPIAAWAMSLRAASVLVNLLRP